METPKSEKQIIKPVEARDFDSNEVGEINQYISANVPYSILQTLFPLTENIYHKCQVFTIVYRILNSSKNYVEDEKTRNNLQKMLDECKEVYIEVYNLISENELTSISYGKHLIQRKIKNILNTFEKNSKINKLIDLFLIFSEKLIMIETNKVAGLEMDTEEGQDFYKKLQSGDTKSPTDSTPEVVT